MALFVDEARWRWRDLRWAHLISDRSTDELHPVAHEVGLRRMGFQGDHYDVPEPLVPALVALGVDQIPSRQLVVALRSSGLRRSPGSRVGHWELLGEHGPSPDLLDRATVSLRGARTQVEAADAVAGALWQAPIELLGTTVSVLHRTVGVVAVIEPAGDERAWTHVATHFEAAMARTDSGAEQPIVVVHRRPGSRLIEVIGAEP